MAKYDKEEIKAFEEKDLRIARESALKNTTRLVAAGLVTFREKYKEAQMDVDFIYNGYGGEPTEPKSVKKPVAEKELEKTELPKPTAKQQQIIDEVCEAFMAVCPEGYVVNEELVKEQILKFHPAYPKLKESKKTVIKEISIDDVIVEDN